MSFKCKLLVVVIMLALVTDYGLAAWPDTQALPVPGNSEEVKKEARRIAGQEFEFTYYTSTQDAKAIKDFYRSRLTNSGWKEKAPLKDLQQTPNFKIEPSLSQAFEQNLLFEKEGTMLIVALLPEKFSQDTKTRFSVARGKLDFQAPLSADADFIPELLTKPKRDIAPTYPGAALLFLSEPPNGLRLTYSTKDDINTVAAFYKAKMPDYGWSLVEEQASEKIEASDMSKDEIATACPTCAKNMLISPQDIENWIGELSFSNQKGDTCKVILSRVAPMKEVPGASAINTILVNYEEKKE